MIKKILFETLGLMLISTILIAFFIILGAFMEP
jgi:hypothetical protein